MSNTCIGGCWWSPDCDTQKIIWAECSSQSGQQLNESSLISCRGRILPVDIQTIESVQFQKSYNGRRCWCLWYWKPIWNIWLFRQLNPSTLRWRSWSSVKDFVSSTPRISSTSGRWHSSYRCRSKDRRPQCWKCLRREQQMRTPSECISQDRCLKRCKFQHLNGKSVMCFSWIIQLELDSIKFCTLPVR